MIPVNKSIFTDDLRINVPISFPTKDDNISHDFDVNGDLQSMTNEYLTNEARSASEAFKIMHQ